jgi:pimeloyl-ACP methyl ester carboxylesterase
VTSIIATSFLVLPAMGARAAARPTVRDCHSASVAAPDSGIAGAAIYGELCVPAGQRPSAVQLLVHGATYTHTYWDWPLDPQLYSYVNYALAAGYATLAVDRLGTGLSTRPSSGQDTLSAGAGALHDVITHLRHGGIAGYTFKHVIWVGHSFGTAYAWIEVSQYRDVDAFVLTGLLHAIKPSLLTAPSPFYPAPDDPKFAGVGLDPGYLTSLPGTRGNTFYYAPGADPAVISLDEQLKDTISVPELTAGTALVDAPPPATAPSRAITVPTLLVVGQQDNLFCGPPDGLDCTPGNVLKAETPYYSAGTRLAAFTIPNTGHDLNLHYSAPLTDTLILGWLAATRIP